MTRKIQTLNRFFGCFESLLEFGRRRHDAENDMKPSEDYLHDEIKPSAFLPRLDSNQLVLSSMSRRERAMRRREEGRNSRQDQLVVGKTRAWMMLDKIILFIALRHSRRASLFSLLHALIFINSSPFRESVVTVKMNISGKTRAL